MSGNPRQVPAVMVSQPSGLGPHPGGHAIPEHQPTQQQPHQQPHQHQHQHQQHNQSQSQSQIQSEIQQQQQQQQQADMAVKLTRGTSCVLCQQRKVRCDKNKPCANCVKARVECRVVPPQPPRRRKKRLQEKDLVERLKKYEVLLSENNIKFESIAADLPGAGGGGGGGSGGGRGRSGSAAGESGAGGGDIDETEEGMDGVTELENDFEGLRTSAGSSTSPSVGSGRRSQTEKPFKWMPFHKEFRASEQLLQDSSEDEVDGSTIHNAFDKMYQNQDGFPFIVGARSAPVTHLHPPPIHIFQLWQVYINRINPLLRMTHVPTVQGQVIEASAKLDKVSQSLEALMFGIYLMAVISLEDGEAQKTFGEPKTGLVSKYYSAVQQALINAGFMRSNEISVLQAYTLFLIAARQFMDPRQIFCLSSIAVRIGQRMGLHRDPTLFGHSPYEVEQRRRLWWTIVAYDVRIGEMTGSTVTALSTPSDCRLPLNINDTELHVDGKDAPTPHQGPTEMLFCLARLELCLAVRNDPSRDVPTAIGLNAGSGSPPTSSPPGAGSTPGSALATNAAAMSNAAASASAAAAPVQPARPIPTVRIANQENLSYTLDGFAAHIESQYFRHCDEKIPLHFFTLTMTRQALCKMRIIAFLVRMGQGDDNPLNEAERETLFLEAVQMIEYDNVLQSAESLRYYKWYTYMHFPFPAYMFLVTELRHRTTGPMVERAWVAVSENHERRRIMNKIHNPMHLAFGKLFVKAWDAHELGERAVGKVLREPEWIERLRVHAERSKSRSTEPEGGMMGGMGFMGGGGPGGPLGGMGGFGKGMGMDMGVGMGRGGGGGGGGGVPSMAMGGNDGGVGGPGSTVGTAQDEQRTPTRHYHASEESMVASPVDVVASHARKSVGSRTPQQQQQQQKKGGTEYADMDWSYIMQDFNMSGAYGLSGQGGGPPAGSSNMYQ